jgi:UDP-glucuronate decarboxylase
MVKWISEHLGTASYYDDLLTEAPTSHLLDVRELRDGEGNDPARLRMIIDEGARQLRLGKRLLVCCDKGISRSNAIALGTLLATGTSYAQALERLAEAGMTEVSLGMLKDIRLLYEPDGRSYPRRPSQILVTGATGFVGKAVLAGLGEPYRLLALDRSRFHLSRDFLALDDFVREQQVDTVLHLAHPRAKNGIAAMGEALAMMKAVLELCRLNGLRLVYLSNLAIFAGYTDAGVAQAEAALPPRPKGVYAETKYLCEQLIECYRGSLASEVAVLRPGLVYGPNMEQGMFVPKFFEWAMEHKVIRTHRYDNGAPFFDFLYIDDLVNAIRLALGTKAKFPIHLGTGVATTTHDLASEIVRITHSSSSIETLNIRGEAPRVVANPDEAAKHLQFKAEVNVATGLENIWRGLG